MLSASKATLSLPSFLSAEDKGMGYGALEELSVRNSLATASAAGVVRVRELTFLFLHSVSPWPCSDVASSVVEAVQVGTPPGAPSPVHDLRLGWEGAMSSLPCMRPGVEASSLVTSGHSWCAPSAQNPSPSSFPTGPPPHSLLTPLGGEHGLPSLTVRGGSPHALRAPFFTLLLSPSLVSSRTGRLVRGAGPSWAVARRCKTCWRGRWIGAACGQRGSREGVNPVNGVGGRGAGLRLRVPLLVLHLLRSPCHGVPGAVGGAGFEPLVE